MTRHSSNTSRAHLDAGRPLPALVLWVLRSAFLATVMAASACGADHDAPIGDPGAEARVFMTAYAQDLRAGDRDRLVARYHADGAYMILNGQGGLRSHAAIATRYAQDWVAPTSFEWVDLVYEVLGPDAVALVGQFDWGDASGTARYSYTGLLRREEQHLKIVLEDETRLGVAPDSADGAAASKAEVEAERAVRAAIAEWVEIYNRNDWTALGEQFSEDAAMMPPNALAAIGRTAISAWEAANEQGFRIALQPDEITIAGDRAIIRGRSCVFVPLDDDAFGVDVGKFLEVRRRQPDGRWLVTHDVFNSDLPAGAALAAGCPDEIVGDAAKATVR